ncbi:hypothetical protein [Sorangium sp. So ce1182]|uniref:hypothetical protein n=1 Tax=Sorangium sp. So ce1182 TaxID=3133334 RepID=UPI003F5ECA33
MVDMHIIMGMPPHIIIMGMPVDILFIIDSQQLLSMSIDMPSAGIILQVIPSLVISQVILHIMGMFPPIVLIMLDVIGMPMPVMLGIIPIMPGIIGMPMLETHAGSG